jgi:hypothetical protein
MDYLYAPNSPLSSCHWAGKFKLFHVELLPGDKCLDAVAKSREITWQIGDITVQKPTAYQQYQI